MEDDKIYMEKITPIHRLSELKDGKIYQKTNHKSKTVPHKIEETVDKGSSCTYEKKDNDGDED